MLRRSDHPTAEVDGNDRSTHVAGSRKTERPYRPPRTGTKRKGIPMTRAVTSPWLCLQALTVAVLTTLARDVSAQGSPCTLGSCEPAFDHPGGPAGNPPPCANPPVAFPSGTFDGIRANLIPKGPHRGHVMAFNHITYTGNGIGQTRVITYTIFDPQTQQFWDHTVCLAPDQGDLFCVGHTWNAVGDLVLAGGTTTHKIGNQAFGGAKLVYVWRPPTTLGDAGTWFPGPLLDDFRWYPSLLALGPDPITDDDPVLVLGGTDPATGRIINSYQCWRPAGGAGGLFQSSGGNPPFTFNGPSVAGTELADYPRAHFLSTKEAATAGMSPFSAKVEHFGNPGAWPISAMAAMGGVPLGELRLYGSSVLFPISPGGGIKDVLVATGGKTGGDNIVASWEWSHASASMPKWTQPSTAMYQPRWFLNTVLLPDSTVLACGGEQQYGSFGCSEVPALLPEILVAGQWQTKLGGTIIRDYHSTALLLPNAKVLTAGGESRHYAPWPNCNNKTGRVPTVAPADFQVFVPPYINCGNVRPSINVAAGATLSWSYGTQNPVGYVTLPFGISIAKVVLMRAGSVTHHCDPNQRCVELAFTLAPDVDPPTGFSACTVAVPSKASYLLPRGYYMLFLVTNQGTPSQAAWVLVS